MKDIRTIGIAVLTFTLVSSSVHAGWWTRRPAPVVDKNRDGVVTPREVAIDKAQKADKAKVNTPWEAAADANKDGVVQPAERVVFDTKLLDANRDGVITPAERLAYWNAHPVAALSPLQKKYDLNNDGVLNWAECREYLKDRHRVLSTGGKAVVNSPLEAQFDLDRDGVLNAAEAKALLDAVN